MKLLALTLLLLCVAVITVPAQTTFPVPPQTFTFCADASRAQRLYCVLPTYGLHNAPFNNFAPFNLTGPLNLNNLIGAELSLLPVSSPASGIVFSFDKQLGTVTRSVESFGPILTERSETIGRHRLFLGLTYEHYGFESFNGSSLKSLSLSSFVFAQSIDTLGVNQFTGLVDFGLTNRIDVSAIVPFRQVRLNVSGQSGVVNPDNTVSLQHSNEHHEASGISDILFRVKGRVWWNERGGVSLGVDVRAPTGEPLDFLGAGAPGVKPFLVASYRRRVGKIYLAPHLNVGYEFNGTSVLGGNLLGQEGRLPRRFLYSFGTEVGLMKKATVTLDFLGERLFSAQRDSLQRGCVRRMLITPKENSILESSSWSNTDNSRAVNSSNAPMAYGSSGYITGKRQLGIARR